MIARRLAFRLFARIEGARLEITEPSGRVFAFGPAGAQPRARVRIHDDGVYAELMRGSNGLAETYMDGRWDCDDLVALVRLCARQMRSLDAVRRRWHPVLHGGQRLARLVPHNDRAGARANIAAHYDLGNELFSLFLDPTMMYSCAYFDSPEATLEQAQITKLDRICRALDLQPGDRLLEIGTGWGALACHAAAHYGAQVTTTTISREQHSLATDRVRAAGLEDDVELLLTDYRDLDGRYDKLVSIEMIEAVGWQYFDTYFERCSELLEPDGLMLLQAITIDDRAFEVEKASKSFINTHIFPGGCLPSQEVIAACLARGTDLTTVWLDDITAHYAETCRHWRQGFTGNRDRAAALGYDPRFRRMWDLYLAYVEAGFRERRIMVVQQLAAKPAWRAADPGLAIPARIAGEHRRGDPVHEEARAA